MIKTRVAAVQLFQKILNPAFEVISFGVKQLRRAAVAQFPPSVVIHSCHIEMAFQNAFFDGLENLPTLLYGQCHFIFINALLVPAHLQT